MVVLAVLVVEELVVVVHEELVVVDVLEVVVLLDDTVLVLVLDVVVVAVLDVVLVLVELVVLLLEDAPPAREDGAPGAAAARARMAAQQAEGFFWDMGREAQLERAHGVSFPAEEALSRQAEALEAGAEALAAAGAVVVRLDCRAPLAELLEAANSRADALVFGAPVDPARPGAVEVGEMARPEVDEATGAPHFPPRVAGLQVLGHLAGFCPVAWRRSGGALVPGDAACAAEWHGLLYLCAGEAERAAAPETDGEPLADLPEAKPGEITGALREGAAESEADIREQAAKPANDELPPLFVSKRNRQPAICITSPLLRAWGWPSRRVPLRMVAIEASLRFGWQQRN